MKKTRVAITGYQGFLGSYLINHLSDPHVSLYSVSDAQGPVNILDKGRLFAFITSTKPNVILHLAAQSNIPRSFDDPVGTYRDNFLGVANILDILRQTQFKGKFLLASTAHVYGSISEQDLPVSEQQPKKPISPYGLSKFCAEELVMMESQIGSIEPIIVRPFNITGPGQSNQFVLPSLAKQVIEVALGQKDCIVVGNLDVSRDFLDIKDATQAFINLCKYDCPSGAYNLCSGQMYSLKDLLEKMMALANVDVPIVVDKVRFRPSDQPTLIGCNEKLKKETGWRPNAPIEQTLTDLLNYWRNQLCQKSAL